MPAEFEFSLYYGEPSRHHNKIQKDSTFDGQKYDKILTPNRLSEFIINVETGEFVTEWDVLKTKDTQTVMSKGSSYKKEKESFPKKGGGYGIFQLCSGGLCGGASDA